LNTGKHLSWRNLLLGAGIRLEVFAFTLGVLVLALWRVPWAAGALLLGYEVVLAVLLFLYAREVMRTSYIQTSFRLIPGFWIQPVFVFACLVLLKREPHDRVVRDLALVTMVVAAIITCFFTLLALRNNWFLFRRKRKEKDRSP
jgi:hypothetical protein